MSRFIPAFVLASLAALAGAAPAQAQSERTFEVFNRNGWVSIERIWTAPSNNKYAPWTAANLDWAVGPRRVQRLTLGWGPTCFYDVKVQFADGSTATAHNINVCRNDRVLAD
jgi:hypothetical protein